MTYRVSVTSTALFCMATLFGVSDASAQSCENGVCRLNSRPDFDAAPTGLHGYRGNDYRRDSDHQLNLTGNRQYSGHSAATCADGRCALHGDCPECGCNGEYCNCGPNCPTHYQSRNESRTPGRPLVPNRPPSRDYRTGPLLAPRPSAQSYRPTSYRTTLRWEQDFRAAAEQSRQSGRPLLVRVTADWCSYCQKMKRETFADQSIMRDISRGFIAVNVDADTNRQLVQQMRVETLPTTLVIDSNMRIVERLEGFQTPQQLSQALRRHAQRAQLDTSAQVAIR